MTGLVLDPARLHLVDLPVQVADQSLNGCAIIHLGPAYNRPGWGPVARPDLSGKTVGVDSCDRMVAEGVAARAPSA